MRHSVVQVCDYWTTSHLFTGNRFLTSADDVIIRCSDDVIVHSERDLLVMIDEAVY